MKSILIVCTGNICRSPMAEGILKLILANKNHTEIKVLSAGIAAGTGFPASVNAVTAMAELGIDIRAHRSQPITSKLVKESDLILAMELYHKECIEQSFPEAVGKVKLVKEFGIHSDTNPDIDDPIGGSIASYRYTAEEINRCLIDFVAQYFEGRE
ncbi:MAG: low molecular weight protein arginine phosphatase [bacterium]